MTPFAIPQGEQKITVELTIKEAIALSGMRFNQQPQLMVSARKKIQGILNQKLFVDTDKLHYHHLEV
jgi:hypothetical protein